VRTYVLQTLTTTNVGVDGLLRVILYVELRLKGKPIKDREGDDKQ